MPAWLPYGEDGQNKYLYLHIRFMEKGIRLNTLFLALRVVLFLSTVMDIDHAPVCVGGA